MKQSSPSSPRPARRTSTPGSAGSRHDEGGGMHASASSAILNQMFPPLVAEKLKNGERVEPELFANVTILFADVVGWTGIAGEVTPLQAYSILNDLYSVTDYCLSYFMRLYKVETVGDAIMIMEGGPVYSTSEGTIEELLLFIFLVSIAVSKFVKNPINGAPLNLRFGLHTGDVVGGIAGSLMPRHTFSGDAVNVAARVQGVGVAESIVVSATTAIKIARHLKRVATCESHKLTGTQSLADYLTAQQANAIEEGTEFRFEMFKLVSGGLQFLKGKGEMLVFYVVATSAKKPPSKALTRIEMEADVTWRSLVRSRSFLSLDDLSVLKSTSGRDDSSIGSPSVFQFERGAYSRLNETQPTTSLKERLDDFIHTDPTARLLLAALGSKSSLSSNASNNTMSEQTTKDELDADADADADADSNSISSSNSSDDDDDEGEIVEWGDGAFPQEKAAPHCGIVSRILKVMKRRDANKAIAHAKAAKEWEDKSDSQQNQAKKEVEEEEDEADVISMRQQGLLDPGLLDGMRILVVEDSSVQSKLMCRSLRALNSSWVVDAVSSHTEVMEMLKASNFAYDMMLLDMNLGEASLDGPTILKKMKKAFPRFMSHVVAVMTSKDSQERELEASFSHADAFWAKPLAERRVLHSHILFVVIGKAGEIHREARDKAREKRRKLRLQQMKDEGVDDGHSEDRDNEASTSSHKLTALLPVRTGGTIAIEMTSPLLSEARSTILGRGANQRKNRSADAQLISFDERFETRPELKILVVEDSAAQRKLMIRKLKECCGTWSVTGVQDSAEAIRYLRAHDFKVDVLFVDMNLGDDSKLGSELVRLLRSTYKMTTQVVVGLNRDTREISSEFLLAGADSAWSKPLPSQHIMLRRLHQLINIRNSLYGLG